MAKSRPVESPVLLGIECGGTRTVALRQSGDHVSEWRGGPANLRLLNDTALRRHFRTIRKALGTAQAMGIGMAGARTEADWARIRKAAAAVWPGVPCHATNDLETALAAGQRSTDRAPRTTQVLVLSGTGSCCYGRTADGRVARMGGWGHVIGDKGSGFEIGLRGVKAAVFYWDRDGLWTGLGQRLLRTLQLNEPDDFIAWAQTATKPDMAALAVEVFAAAARRDRIARDVLEGAAHSLAKDAVSCARKLVRRRSPVHFVFAGSVLLQQPAFTRKVARLIRREWPGAVCEPLKRPSVWGALELARKLSAEASGNRPSGADPSRSAIRNPQSAMAVPWDVRHLAASPTEQRNPRSLELDRLPLADAIRLMLDEDARLPKALLPELPGIEWTVRRIVRAFRTGGRLFYCGAGTSGRLGVLDASECPPTFRADPELVQAIMAGGQRAIWLPVEGAEDDPEAGAAAVRFRGVGKGDVLVGIAASGRTPFVWGALWEAKRRGTTTVLLCFNPNLQVRRSQRPHRILAPNLGPEILTGSTRLKSGTATKLILNIFTTLAMVRIGKVVSNLMVDVNPSNVKLRDRAVRIVRQLTDVEEAEARRALEASGWVVKDAWKRLGKLTSRAPAARSGRRR
jgi:N-acetylmuramic acid 6-phosphate etherase